MSRAYSLPFSRRRLLSGFAAGGAGLWLRPSLALAEPGKLLRLAARPENYESPLSALSERITPVDSFYIRSHHDTPAIDPSAWRLEIDGLTERSFALSLADLEKYAQTEVEAVLQCAGNGRALFRPRMPGVQWQRGAMGNALWKGVRLSDVLKRAAPKKEAQHLVLRGADRAVLPTTPSFVRSIPLEKALHPDTIIATHMNGAPLTPSHGFPARLVVPGWVADDWVKWLSKLSLSATPGEEFFIETAYRFPDPPGAPGEAIPAERMQPMDQLRVKAVITSPAAGAVVPPGKATVMGVAFSGESAVSKVEISVDGQKSWATARFESPSTAYGWRVFKAEVTLAGTGPVAIAARAADQSGAIQPTTPVWNPSGYLHNAIDPVVVEVRA